MTRKRIKAAGGSPGVVGPGAQRWTPAHGDRQPAQTTGAPKLSNGEPECARAIGAAKKEAERTLAL